MLRKFLCSLSHLCYRLHTTLQTKHFSPNRIRTAYVERTYDTSGYALNYQILTRAIEDAVAAMVNGFISLKKC